MSLVILVESLSGNAKSDDLIAGGCFLFGGIAMFLIGMRSWLLLVVQAAVGRTWLASWHQHLQGSEGIRNIEKRGYHQRLIMFLMFG